MSVLAVSPFLALGMLACPVGMGAMMWFMARGSHSPASSQQPATLEDLRREHARLGTQIEGLQHPQPAAEDAPAPQEAPPSRRPVSA